MVFETQPTSLFYTKTKNRPNYIIESVFGFSEEELEHIRKKPTGR